MIPARVVRALPWLVLVGLWALAAWNRSLWVDELHSLHHARAEDWPTFFRVVRSDNHPPLSFLVLRMSMGLLGEGHYALRLPGLLYALAFQGMVLRFARRFPDPSVRAWAPWLVLLSSYRLMVFTEARMYGLLALCVLCLVETVLTAFEDEQGVHRVRTALASMACVGIALHTHYYSFHYLAVLGLFVLWSAWREPALRAPARWLLVGGVVGAATFVPWALWGFLEQLEHGLPAGSNYARIDTWLQSIAHLLFMNASLGGDWVTYAVALPGALAAFALALLGVACFRQWSSRPEAKRFCLALLAVGIGVPVWAALSASFIPRASYNWPYISASCVPIVFLVAAGRASRRQVLARALTVFVAVSMAYVSLVNAFASGHEDFRGAVADILANVQPGDAIITRAAWDLDPPGSPSGWQYYIDRLERPEGPLPTEYRLPNYRPALEHRRVWTFIRRRWSKRARNALEAAYPHEEVHPIGEVLTVHLYWRE